MPRITITVTSGPLKHQKYLFEQHETFVFGRSSDCHACLPRDDKTASRHHFMLEVSPPRVWVQDLGSTNGTKVNQKQPEGTAPGDTGGYTQLKLTRDPLELRDGDVIKVGHSTFEVTVDAKEDGAEAGTENLAESSALGGEGRSSRSSAPEKTGFNSPEQGEFRSVEEYLVARYGKCEELGKGGMGRVYKVSHAGRPYAVKTLLTEYRDDKMAVRAERYFRREIDALTRLRHPNLVSLLDHGVVEHLTTRHREYFFVMEYCEGGDLYSAYREKPLSVGQIVKTLAECLQGLCYIHKQGFVHRDLKPQNILIHKGHAKIGDFGLAKRTDDSGFTKTGTAGGALYYMAREQLLDFKHTRPVSDVFSLAAAYYRVLTNEFVRDFDSNPVAALVVLQSPVVPMSRRATNLPPYLVAMFDKALADKPQARYQNAGEFLSALNATAVQMLPQGLS